MKKIGAIISVILLVISTFVLTMGGNYLVKNSATTFTPANFWPLMVPQLAMAALVFINWKNKKCLWLAFFISSGVFVWACLVFRVQDHGAQGTRTLKDIQKLDDVLDEMNKSKKGGVGDSPQ